MISSIGVGRKSFMDGLRAGRSMVAPITSFDTTGFEYQRGCEISDFDASEFIRHADANRLGRATQFSVTGAIMAVTDSGMDVESMAGQRAAVSIGTTSAEMLQLDLIVEQQVASGCSDIDPVLAQKYSSARLSTEVARKLGLADVRASTLGTACAAGNYAIGDAFDAVRSGDVDIAICGGVDVNSRRVFTGFYRLGMISPDVCRPFDINRAGILTGEGAGVFLLETLESAQARGAHIYAEVLGYGLTCDAFHSVAPDVDGIARCIRRAHSNAGVEPEDIDLISAHGTGTKTNDATEVAAIKLVFGESPPPTIGIKSMLGHTMGAASSLAAAACTLSITEHFMPPTINHELTDPQCAIDCVPNHARPFDVKVAQNNAFAFGGNNAVLILARYPWR